MGVSCKHRLYFKKFLKWKRNYIKCVHTFSLMVKCKWQRNRARACRMMLHASRWSSSVIASVARRTSVRALSHSHPPAPEDGFHQQNRASSRVWFILTRLRRIHCENGFSLCGGTRFSLSEHRQSLLRGLVRTERRYSCNTAVIPQSCARHDDC